MLFPNSTFFSDLASKLADMAAHGPTTDLKKNLTALATAHLAQLNLVTREEFDIQCAMLQKAEMRLGELEKQITQFEQEKAR